MSSGSRDQLSLSPSPVFPAPLSTKISSTGHPVHADVVTALDGSSSPGLHLPLNLLEPPSMSQGSISLGSQGTRQADR